MRVRTPKELITHKLLILMALDPRLFKGRVHLSVFSVIWLFENHFPQRFPQLSTEFSLSLTTNSVNICKAGYISSCKHQELVTEKNIGYKVDIGLTFVVTLVVSFSMDYIRSSLLLFHFYLFSRSPLFSRKLNQYFKRTV